MPESIHGFKIGSSEYQYDYNYLSNKPTSIPAYACADEFKALIVSESGSGVEWSAILPDKSGQDPGSVLGLDDNADVSWLSPLPTWSSQSSGKVLTITNDGSGPFGNLDGVDWVSPESGIPSWDSQYEDVGKVLAINDENELVWKEILPQQEAEYKGLVLTADGSGNVSWDSVLPSYDKEYDSDSGKSLTINGSSLEWQTILPTYDTTYQDEGKVLAITNNEPAWLEIIPPYDSSDAGKVLSVNNDGELEWVTP